MKTLKNIVKLILYITTIIIAINYLFNIYRPYYNNTAYKPIEYAKQKKNSINVLFVGSSSVHNGVSPMQLYRDYGFTAFDMSYSSATIKLNYYQILNALNNQKPQLIVLDMSEYFNEDISLEQQHINVDYMPINNARIKFVNDESNEFNNFQKLSFIFPFFSYHDNWKNKKINQYFDSKTLEKSYKDSISKGFITYIGDHKQISNFQNKNYMDDIPKEISIQNSSYDYLLKIKDLCDKKNITLQLFCMPNSLSWNKSKSEAIKKLSEELGVNFIDSNEHLKDMNIDLNYDFKDGATHLNIVGARKLTDYLGKYLTSKYSLKDCRNDKYYSNWNEDLKNYEKLENKAIDSYNAELKKIKEDSNTNTKS